MKKLLLVMFILASVSSVYAADAASTTPSALKISGDFYVGGNMAMNDDFVKSGKSTYSYFDYDLNLNAALKASENATVFVRLTYDKNVVGSGKVEKVESTNQNASSSVLAIERAYLNYKFMPSLQLDAGLMGGGQWGTLFGNTEANIMRVKLTWTAAEGMDFLAIYQKNTEQYNNITATETSENNDDNTYYLGAKMTFGPVKVQPLLSYQTRGTNYGDGVADNELDYAKAGADVAVYGDFGMFGFEAEVVYFTENADYAAAATDKKEDTTSGEYVNLFLKLNPLTAGLVLATASDNSDTQEGVYNWGKDFDVTVVMDDWCEATLAGWTVAKLYASDIKIGSDITLGAALAYGMDNVKDGEANFIEIDATFAYALDAQTEYSINAGYAMTDKMTAAEEKANCFAMYHGIKTKF